MKRLAIVLMLAVAAGCNGPTPGSPPPSARPPAPPPTGGTTVTLKRSTVTVAHLARDPERRYPRGPGSLCSWNRDRILHFFSTDTPKPCDVVLLDAAGRVVEIASLASHSDVGITSKVEARHALFLSAGAVKEDGLAEGDVVKFSKEISDAKIEAMPVVKIDGHEVHVETSHRLTERQRGLMHRPRLSKDNGMLFLYEVPGERSFWMQNTLIPLDISYFDAEGRLLNVARMKAHEDPSKGGELKAPSAGAARYVLEVNYGWYDAHGLIDAEGKPKKPIRMELPEALRKLADLAD